jgi:hypothetical protein
MADTHAHADSYAESQPDHHTHPRGHDAATTHDNADLAASSDGDAHGDARNGLPASADLDGSRAYGHVDALIPMNEWDVAAGEGVGDGRGMASISRQGQPAARRLPRLTLSFFPYPQGSNPW